MSESALVPETGWSFRTAAVHAGERAAWPDCRPLSTPIYSSAAYLAPDMQTSDAIFGGSRDGYVYTRYGNPTVAALEQAVAALESSEAALAYASGMAAVHGALLAAGLQAGDRVVASRDVYGATYALLATVIQRFGVNTTFVDICDLEAVGVTMGQQRPRLLLAETVSNPLLRVADISALASIAHNAGAILVVDSSFTSPYLIQPRRLGADIVVHSATKYLGGHGDVTGGLMVSNRDTVSRAIELTKLVGGILGPFEAWLILRGIKTLPLRLDRHCQNALQLAWWLSNHSLVAKVNYPGLPTHPQYKLASQVLRSGRFGGMISFEIAGADQPRVMRFLDSLKLCLPATTLGDVYTELLYPAISSHRALGAEQRAAIGISDGLVRISTGIEDIDDVQHDLDQALAASIA